MADISPAHAPGHYYSPVNDVRALDRSEIERRRLTVQPQDLKGIRIDDAQILAHWQKAVSLAGNIPFPKDATLGHRYYYWNSFYGIGDAFFHYSVVSTARPTRYIEIGSGFSSACFLDTIDNLGLDVRCTFIEPYAARLRGLMTQRDLDRHEIIEKPVQAMDLSLFEELGADDILFVDSTHVLKTGSDVAFELFEILPRLRPGVIVHFHDIFWPFEYPSRWIFDLQYSWNELYALRAFLTFNDEFDILFFNDYLCAKHGDLIQAANLPDHLKIIQRSCGGGLWLRRR